MHIPDQAALQGGCFTTEQALRAGWSTERLRTADRRGRLHRVRRGVWIEAALFGSLDARAAHEVAVRADLLVLGPGWYAARRSRAVLAGVPLLGSPPTQPQLLGASARSTARSSSRHRHLARLPVWQRDESRGLAVTTLDRMAIDLARQESFRSALVVVDAVLGRGVTHANLTAVLDGMRRWPGVEQARRVLDLADGLAESPLESLSRFAALAGGLAPPELQVEVWHDGRFLGRGDFLWRACNLIGEADGVAKYGDTDRDRREAFARAKRRTEALEDVGFEVVHWGWEDAYRSPDVLVERLRRGTARGAGKRLDPGVRFVPTTVEQRWERRRAA